MNTQRESNESHTTSSKQTSSSSSDNIEFRDSNTMSGGQGPDLNSLLRHRFKNEFEEIRVLGKGAYGRVMKAKNRFDSQEYAVKMVELRYPPDHEESMRVQEEAKLLAKLQHPHVVRYFASWLEAGCKIPSCFCWDSDSSKSGSDEANENETACKTPQTPENHNATGRDFLFIQMELCTKTLRSVIDSGFDDSEDLKSDVGRFLYEIAIGLMYIHQKGLCHRDLNPNNIFLDVENRIKIGDFGLAKDRFSESYLAGEVCSDVGTRSYKAPEINSKRYDTSVDSYSLGIIMFELLHPMTHMERAEVITNLRLPEVIFPDDFCPKDLEWTVTTIRMLLSHSPAKRLSLQKLLLILSEKFPCVSTNIQEVMDRVLLEPSSSSYQHVVSACINQVPKSEEDINFDFPKHCHDLGKHFCVHNIVKYIESIFHKHGASHVSTPLLTPSHFPNESASVVKLMTGGGFVVNLPHNARLNFARYVVWNEVTRQTRYDTLQTYTEHCTRSHPRPTYECVFDIITPRPGSLVCDAHLLTVLKDVYDEIPWKMDTLSLLIVMNHCDLVKAVLLSVGVKEKYLSNALETIGEKGSWDELDSLSPDKFKLQNLDKTKLDKICNLSSWGSPEILKEQLLGEIDGDCTKMAEIAIDDLRKICDIFFSSNFHKIRVNLKLCSNVNHYSGMFFTAKCVSKDFSKNITIADGGRYDETLLTFREALAREKPDIVRRPQYGTGMSVYPLKVLKIKENIWPPELVVVTCQENETLEVDVRILSKAFRDFDINCRSDFDAQPSDIEVYKADENVLCLIQLLADGSKNITWRWDPASSQNDTMEVNVTSDLQGVFNLVINNILMLYRNSSFSASRVLLSPGRGQVRDDMSISVEMERMTIQGGAMMVETPPIE